MPSRGSELISLGRLVLVYAVSLLGQRKEEPTLAGQVVIHVLIERKPAIPYIAAWFSKEIVYGTNDPLLEYPLIFVDKMSGRSIWLNKDRNAVMSRVFRLPGEKEGKGLAY
jgi:hypothetical protein